MRESVWESVGDFVQLKNNRVNIEKIVMGLGVIGNWVIGELSQG